MPTAPERGRRSHGGGRHSATIGPHRSNRNLGNAPLFCRSFPTRRKNVSGYLRIRNLRPAGFCILLASACAAGQSSPVVLVARAASSPTAPGARRRFGNENASEFIVMIACLVLTPSNGRGSPR